MLVGDDIKELPKDVQLKIIKMQNSAERMQILISDILKYTKTTAQHSDLEIIDLNVLLQEIKEEVIDSLEDNNAELLISELPTIQGVGFLLKQLFTNIIYNSLKFKSEARKPIISIRENKTSKDKYQKSGNYYKIEIEDNGIGFDNEYSQKIFKIFSRLNDKNEYLGSGIGLALCKKIMTKHNGLIAAEGQLDKGTIIKIYFPKN